MRIEKLLEKEQTLPPLTAEQISVEREAFSHAELKIGDIGFSEYISLLPLIRLAVSLEQSTLSNERQVEFARANTIKLITAFGTRLNAISYLQAFEAHNHPIEVEAREEETQQLVHNACLFELPTDLFDIMTWREIIAFNHPTNPSDLILRLFPFAVKIEAYLKENQVQLILEAEASITHERSLVFTDEYKEKCKVESNDFVKNAISAQLKKERKKLEFEFLAYCKNRLDLNDVKKFTSEQQAQLRVLGKDLLPEERAALTVSMQAAYDDAKKKREGLEAQFITLKQTLTTKYAEEFNSKPKQLNDEQAYISFRLKQEAKSIHDAARQRGTLSRNIPLVVLQEYCKYFCYQNAAKNPLAAKLFFAYGKSESSFDRFLSLVAKDDAVLIPAVHINGEQVSADPDSQHYILEKLVPQDPCAGILGKLTSCCQSIGENGDEPTVFGITQRHAGFYVMRDTRIPAADNIVAQCLAWRGRSGEIVFDSVESHSIFRRKHKQMVVDFFLHLANYLVIEHGVPRVLVGSGETPADLKTLMPFKLAIPVADDGQEYNGYRDSNRQYLLVDFSLPIFVFNEGKIIGFKINNPLTLKMLGKVCDLTCVGTNAQHENLFKFIKIFSEMLSIDEQFAQNRMRCMKQWMDLVLELHRNRNFTKVQLSLFKKLRGEKFNLEIPIVVSERLNIILYPLTIAAESSCLEAVKCLIKNGAQIDGLNYHGMTALAAAALAGNLETVRYLVDHKADINKYGYGALPPILYAAHHKKWDVVKYLAKQGADLDVADVDGNTALMEAAAAGQLEMVQFLCKRGADIHKRNEAGHNALLRTAGLYTSLEVMQWLAKQGANPNGMIQGNVPLNQAAFYINTDSGILADLINAGADINAKDTYGNTALTAACTFPENLSKVEYLVSHGADVNAVNKKGISAVRYAATRGNWPAVCYLVRQKAKVTEDILDTSDCLKPPSEEVIALLQEALRRTVDRNTLFGQSSAAAPSIDAPNPDHGKGKGPS